MDTVSQVITSALLMVLPTRDRTGHRVARPSASAGRRDGHATGTGASGRPNKAISMLSTSAPRAAAQQQHIIILLRQYHIHIEIIIYHLLVLLPVIPVVLTITVRPQTSSEYTRDIYDDIYISFLTTNIDARIIASVLSSRSSAKQDRSKMLMMIR